MNLRYAMSNTPNCLFRKGALGAFVQFDLQYLFLQISTNQRLLKRSFVRENKVAKLDITLIHDEDEDTLTFASSSQDLICQFGVGFYSTFIIAKKVKVCSKRYNESQLTRGTSVKLYFHQERREKADEEFDIEISKYRYLEFVRSIVDTDDLNSRKIVLERIQMLHDIAAQSQKTVKEIIKEHKKLKEENNNNRIQEEKEQNIEKQILKINKEEIEEIIRRRIKEEVKKKEEESKQTEEGSKKDQEDSEEKKKKEKEKKKRNMKKKDDDKDDDDEDTDNKNDCFFQFFI
ncbi:MAG: hypothetical protein EZS28_002160 [Streblomastix strix]|uniref:Uncharacterized protein n=1 Tax=Streblomastix strix TaxID=222440 RepID=A0A5J4X6N7_9EUKA|nr:MAG: hypothetical protein EZS28_002160 [Streblomastix strix]